MVNSPSPAWARIDLFSCTSIQSFKTMDNIGVLRRPLPEGKVYHFNIIYNHAKSHLSRTEDTNLSLKFVEWIVTSIESMGFVNSYYHDRDSVPGKHLFLELARVINGSYFTIVVFTPGFIRDCWPGYMQMTAFKSLINTSSKGQISQLVPLAVGLTPNQLPKEIPVERSKFFPQDWESAASLLSDLETMFSRTYPNPAEFYTEKQSSKHEKIIPDKRYEDNADGITDATATSPRSNKNVTSPRSNKDVTSPRSNKVGLQDTRNVMHKATLPSTPIPVVNLSSRNSNYITSQSNTTKHHQVAPSKITKETFQVSTITSPAFKEGLNRSAKDASAKRPRETLPPSPEAVVSVSSKNVFHDSLATSREWKSEVIIPENTVISIKAPSLQHSLRSLSPEQKHRRKNVHSLPSNMGSSQTEFTKTTLPATPPASIDIGKKPKLGAELSHEWNTTERLSPEIKLSSNEAFKNTVDASPVAMIQLAGGSSDKTYTKENKQSESSLTLHTSTIMNDVKQSGKKDVGHLPTHRVDMSKTVTSKTILPSPPEAVIKTSDKSVGKVFSGKSSDGVTKVFISDPVVRLTSSDSMYTSQKQKDVLDADREVQMINSSSYSSTHQNIKVKPDTTVLKKKKPDTTVLKENIHDVHSVKTTLVNNNPTSSFGAEINKENSFKDKQKQEMNTSQFRHIDSQQRTNLPKHNIDESRKPIVPQSENVSSVGADKDVGDTGMFQTSDSHRNQIIHEWDDLEISVCNRLESTGFRRDSFSLNEKKALERRNLSVGHSKEADETHPVSKVSDNKTPPSHQNRGPDTSIGDSARSDKEKKYKNIIVGQASAAETVSVKDQTHNSNRASGRNGHPSVKEPPTVSNNKINSDLNANPLQSQHYKEDESAQLQHHIYKFVAEMNPNLDTVVSDRNIHPDHKTTISTSVRNVNNDASSSSGKQKSTPISVASPSEKTKMEAKLKTITSSDNTIHKHVANDAKPENLKDDSPKGIFISNVDKTLGTNRVSSNSNKTISDSPSIKHNVSVGKGTISDNIQTTKQFFGTRTTSTSSNKRTVDNSNTKQNAGQHSSIQSNSNANNTNLKVSSDQAMLSRTNESFANKTKSTKEPFDKQVELNTGITKVIHEKLDASSETDNRSGSKDTGKQSFVSSVDSGIFLDSNLISELNPVNRGIISSGDKTIMKTTVKDANEDTTSTHTYDTLHADDLSYDSWQETTLVHNQSGILLDNEEKKLTTGKKDEIDFGEPSISEADGPTPSHHILLLYRILCHFLSRPEFPFYV